MFGRYKDLEQRVRQIEEKLNKYERNFNRNFELIRKTLDLQTAHIFEMEDTIFKSLQVVAARVQLLEQNIPEDNNSRKLLN